jgi:hypothetical protein
VILLAGADRTVTGATTGAGAVTTGAAGAGAVTTGGAVVTGGAGGAGGVIVYPNVATGLGLPAESTASAEIVCDEVICS